MGCASPPSPTQFLIRDLSRRTSWLEAQLSGFQELMGVSLTAPQAIVPVLSVEEESVPGGVEITVVFASFPGEMFQIQRSDDNLVTWTQAEAPVPAAADPAVSTEWVSPVISLDDTPVYFRVRRYPSLIQSCAIPAESLCA